MTERGINTNSGSTTGGISGGVLPGTATGGSITTTVGEFTGAAPCWNCEPQPGWGYQTVAPETKVQNKSDYGTDAAKPNLSRVCSKRRIQSGVNEGAAEWLPLFIDIGGKYRTLRRDRLLDTIFVNAMWRVHEARTGRQAVRPDAELDLRGVICPYNFVKTKLKLETMEQGQILSVILDAGDPIRNVPMSVSNEGHEVLSQEPLDASYRVMIRRQ